MRLSDFIRTHTEQITVEWENFARTLVPASYSMTSLALRDHIEPILAFIANDIESSQTGLEQIIKSHGGSLATGKESAAETHGALRLVDGFDMNQMASEYRALRACVINLHAPDETTILNALDAVFI